MILTFDDTRIIIIIIIKKEGSKERERKNEEGIYRKKGKEWKKRGNSKGKQEIIDVNNDINKIITKKERKKIIFSSISSLKSVSLFYNIMLHQIYFYSRSKYHSMA